jgi:zinc protease
MRALPLFKALPVFALTALLAACEETPEPVAPPQPPPPPPAPTAEQAPADPAPVTDGDVTIAYANGVKIIVKRIPGAELASLQLYIKGGARNWGAADAGVERLALSVATSGGTTALDKDAFARKLAALGSDLYGETRLDFSAIKAKSLNAKWDDTFALVAGTFLEPALPESELELSRQRQLASLRREQDSPDAQLGLLVHQALFKGHPFEHRAIGTKESVEKLDLAAVKAHLQKLRETSRLVFVTAGDVDPAHVIEKVKGAFGALPRGSFDAAPFPRIAFDKPAVALTEKKLATNYIQGAFPAPGWRDADHPDAMVAMSLLRFRLFEEVRTKRNLSYAPGAGLGGGSSVPTGYLYVTAVDPNTTMKVMLDEAKKLQNEPVSDKELAGTKATFLTNYLMQNESTDGQAAMLAEADLLGGDWKLARTLPERIRAVTAAGVQAYAKKYVARLQVVVLGDPAKIDKGLFGSM